MTLLRQTKRNNRSIQIHFLIPQPYIEKTSRDLGYTFQRRERGKNRPDEDLADGKFVWRDLVLALTHNFLVRFYFECWQQSVGQSLANFEYRRLLCVVTGGKFERKEMVLCFYE
jgi:hypothetical protein